MSQGNVKCVRVLPKDKIYHNIFEAECDVNKSLKKERKIAEAIKREPTLPVLKQPVSFTTGNGILSERQKTWVDANPNEPYVENPTYYRYLWLNEQEKASKTESFFEAQEVRGLPEANYVDSSISKSRNVLEKIHGGRKERHQAAVEELHHELGIISSDLEPCINEASQILKDSFAANDEELSQILKRFSDDQDLLSFTLKALRELWTDVTQTTCRRQGYIVDLDTTFTKIEQDRYKRVCETFKSFNANFEGIAHLMPSDVHRMMEREAEEINSTMICNRRAYADLIATLQKAVVEQERKYYHTWQTRVKTWKKLKTDEAVNKFFDYMNSAEVKQPPEVLRQLECMRKEQSILNRRRMELLNSLRDMKPPGSTKAAVYQWNNALGHITDQLDKVNRKYKEIVQIEYNDVVEQYYSRMEQTKAKLENENIVNGEELRAILNESFLPLIGEKKTRYECEMDMFEKTIENLAIFQDAMMRSLFKFVQGAAHIWDTHEIGLARQERALQEELEDKRHRHDGANQVKEANLDIIMDKMRQDSNQQALTRSLEEAFALLGEIKVGYKTFHSLQLECVSKYPKSIKDELERYDREVCSYFAVDRNKPNLRMQQSRGGKLSSSPRQGRSLRETSPYATSLEEVLKTSNGASFYVITCPGDYGFPDSAVSTRSVKTSMTFLTDQPDMDDYGTLYTEHIILEEDEFSTLRKHLRMQFLESLENWKIEALDRANSVVAAKVEELNSELDLRFHLHKPRSARAQQDVHNVRAAELLMHKERIERHSKGILNTLAEFKSRFQTMIEEHNEETEHFKQAVQALESTFTSATKTHELVAIQDQVSGQVEEYMKKIRTSLRKFRQDLDGMLSSLRNSNARFRKSFKVFSEGGNFSLDEVEEYRRKLERMANKIDQAEGNIMGELEGMESKRLESAMEYAGKLEDRFKHHLFDLTFMEKTTRWITNTQVKIKSEVAKSNSQAKHLAMNLAKLERHIDAVRNPNLDKEQVSAEDIKDELRPIFKTFIDRTVFLDCLLIDSVVCYSALDDTAKTVSFGEEQAIEQASKPRKSGQRKDGNRRVSKSMKKTVVSGEKLQTSSAIIVPVKETEILSPTDVRPKTMPSETERRPTLKHSAQSLPPRTQRSDDWRRQSAARREYLTRSEKKYMVFGEKSDEEQEFFLPKITNILRNSLDGLLAIAETYYRQKGPRSPTRSNILENFDACAQATIQRLTSYKSQAEDYHNQCIQELRTQLKRFLLLAIQVPSLIIESFVQQYSSETKLFVKKTRKDNQEAIDMLENRKKQHESTLRPTLGHPKNRDELEALEKQEKERKELRMKTLKDFTDELKGHEVERAKIFTENLSRMSIEMLALFDAMITVDDVKVGKVEPKPKSTKQILLEKTKPPKNEPENEIEHSSKAGAKWDGLPINELVLTPPDNLIRTPTVTTIKTTAGHLATIEAQTRAYKDYKSNFFASLNQINEDENTASYDEERWQENWTKSLQRIQNLY